jgi:hypothetical protein
MHLRHRWVEIERIGAVVTYRCQKCPKTKTRLRGPVRQSEPTPTPDYPTRPENGSAGATAARRRIDGDAVPHRTPPGPDEIDHASPDYHG